MQIPSLSLPFLGTRAYLHGTTLFDALLPFVPPDAEITFKFSQIISSDRVTVGDERGDASLAWNSASAGAGALHVRPLPASDAIERRPYPEALIGDCAEVVGKSARFAGDSPFSLVATLIPLHKALLAANVQPAVPGQWMFTRLDLRRRPRTYRALELQLAGVIPERLAHSQIVIEGEPLGAIYFSWLPK